MPSPRSESDGGFLFAADPARSSLEQPIFWAPEVLPTIVPIVGSEGDVPDAKLSLSFLSAGEIRHATDGWHVHLRVRDCEHRLWLRHPPTIGVSYAAELPLDQDFEIRAYAARRLWRALHGRTPGPAFHELSAQRRRRLALALRALDARSDGSSYRTIATALFGAKNIPERAWKTHDLRNRTIRLVQTGAALMRGGYRQLLQQGRRRKRNVE